MDIYKPALFHTNFLISLADYLIEKKEYSAVSLNALNRFIAYCIAFMFQVIKYQFFSNII